MLLRTVDVYAFRINCEELRERLLNNCQVKIKLLSTAMVHDLRQACKRMDDKCEEFHTRLSKYPKNIEEFEDVQAAIRDFDVTLADATRNCEDIRMRAGALEAAMCSLSNSGTLKMWNCLAWPKILTRALTKAKRSLPSYHRRFENELKSQKNALTEHIADLRETFNSFCQKGLSQWREADEVADEVSAFQERLKECSDEVEQIASRENVLGVAVSADFEAVYIMTKETKPFVELWHAVAKWERECPEWMDGPFSMIDRDSVNEYVREAWRSMYRLSKYFGSKPGLEQPSKVTARLKSAIEGFKINLPLIRDLRNPDLRARHWKDVSEELNTVLVVDKSMTLERF